MSLLFYAVKASVLVLCFQYMLAFHILQHSHLLDSYLVEFLEAFALGHTFMDKDCIQVLLARVILVNEHKLCSCCNYSDTLALPNVNIVFGLRLGSERCCPQDEHRAILWLSFQTKPH